MRDGTPLGRGTVLYVSGNATYHPIVRTARRADAGPASQGELLSRFKRVDDDDYSADNGPWMKYTMNCGVVGMVPS